MPDSGVTLHVEFTASPDSGTPQLQIAGSDWTQLSSVTDGPDGYVNITEPDLTEKSYLLNDGDIAKVKSGGLIFKGQHLTITKVYWTEE